MTNDHTHTDSKDKNETAENTKQDASGLQDIDQFESNHF